MSSRFLYAISGAITGAAVDLIINLFSAGIQQRAFSSQFSDQAMWGLGGLALLGLLVGSWLGARTQLTVPAPSQPACVEKPDTITITRLRALLSYSKLKGKGIHLSEIVLIGSRVDIDTTT